LSSLAIIIFFLIISVILYLAAFAVNPNLTFFNILTDLASSFAFQALWWTLLMFIAVVILGKKKGKF
jgi:hypothetical protein